MLYDFKFSVSELVPYINWIYFYHAWGVKEAQATELRAEADAVLQRWAAEERLTHFRIGLFEANSQGEDILLYRVPKFQSSKVPKFQSSIIPLLRQQVEPYLCLADFVRPVNNEGIHDTIGVFASTVPFQVAGLMEQTLADRLAEATAERGHELARKQIWGYAPDENLTPSELFKEHYQGKRPAVGYPSLPDQSLNFVLSDIIDFPSFGITLTESGAMIPHASTSGLVISHPQARHFSIGSISEDQLEDYAKRRRMSKDTLRQFISIQ